MLNFVSGQDSGKNGEQMEKSNPMKAFSGADPSVNDKHFLSIKVFFDFTVFNPIDKKEKSVDTFWYLAENLKF